MNVQEVKKKIMNKQKIIGYWEGSRGNQFVQFISQYVCFMQILKMGRNKHCKLKAFNIVCPSHI